jgi:hypothetical protein
MALRFFAEVNRQAKKFMGDEQFTMDGTLIQAWASHNSYRGQDGSDGGDGTDFRDRTRSNNTHLSTSDPDARLSQLQRSDPMFMIDCGFFNESLASKIRVNGPVGRVSEVDVS